jgi:hypothetical protein
MRKLLCTATRECSKTPVEGCVSVYRHALSTLNTSRHEKISITNMSSSVYIGDSATLSFLQLIRMIVDNVAGPSPFTLDPRRHRIVENIITLPENIRHTHLLPDRQTANILVEAYFTNVSFMLFNSFQLITFLTLSRSMDLWKSSIANPS